MLLHVDAVDHETIRGLALTVDGEIAGIEIARGIEMPPVTPAMMTELGRSVETGATPGWMASKIGVAASIEWERRHLRARNHLAEMRRRSSRPVRRCSLVTVTMSDCVPRVSTISTRSAASVSTSRSGLLLRRESAGGDGEVVVTDGKIGEGVETLLVGDRVISGLSRDVDEAEGCTGDDSSAGVSDGAGDTASTGRLERQRKAKNDD